MKQNNRFMIFVATVLVVILGLLFVSVPPNQLPGGAPGASDDETTR